MSRREREADEFCTRITDEVDHLRRVQEKVNQGNAGVDVATRTGYVFFASTSHRLEVFEGEFLTFTFFVSFTFCDILKLLFVP